MNSHIGLITPTETIDLEVSYIPGTLFSRVIETTMLRNQDATETFILTDELPVPHFFEFGATLHFDTESERHQYTQWLQDVINEAIALEYAVDNGGVVLPISAGWLSFSIGTSNPVQLNVMMKLLPTELEWVYIEGDSARMYREDITMSNSDVTWETMTYPRS